MSLGCGVHVTHHAADRYVERVAPELTREQAADVIRGHGPAIVKASNFGCTVVRLGNGARLVLEGRNVITVHGRGTRRSIHPNHYFPEAAE